MDSLPITQMQVRTTLFLLVVTSELLLHGDRHLGRLKIPDVVLQHPALVLLVRPRTVLRGLCHLLSAQPIRGQHCTVIIDSLS